MRLSDYFVTRIVEQSVHLDDLARSVNFDQWSMPDDAEALTIRVAMEIAQLRSGATALIRAPYRQGFANYVSPVLRR